VTSLRAGDENLHDEHGNHIEPQTRSEKARLKRHMERHVRAELPDALLEAVRELEFARAATRQAKAHEDEVQEYAVATARAFLSRGDVKQPQVAELFNINPRTLRTWLSDNK
jgi:hypothetical protein